MITIACIIADARSTKFNPDILYIGCLMVDYEIVVVAAHALGAAS